MPNRNKNKMNQPPTEEGKKRSPQRGAPNRLDKRSEVLQSTDRRQNIGTADEEGIGLLTIMTNPTNGKLVVRSRPTYK